MTRTRLRALSAALALVLVLGGSLAACGGDDGGVGDGVAPTTEAAGADDEADEETTTTAAPETADPFVAAIVAQAEAVGVVAVRDEGDTKVLVMEDGSTEEDLGPACQLARDILEPEPPLATDLAGEVTPCP